MQAALTQQVVEVEGGDDGELGKEGQEYVCQAKDSPACWKVELRGRKYVHTHACTHTRAHPSPPGAHTRTHHLSESHLPPPARSPHTHTHTHTLASSTLATPHLSRHLCALSLLSPSHPCTGRTLAGGERGVGSERGPAAGVSILPALCACGSLPVILPPSPPFLQYTHFCYLNPDPKPAYLKQKCQLCPSRICPECVQRHTASLVEVPVTVTVTVRVTAMVKAG